MSLLRIGWMGLLFIFLGNHAMYAQDDREKSLLELANQARQEAGLKPLIWDASLGTAAHAHAVRMSTEGPIAHRYGGEPDVAERAASAGAHFSLIEENIAVGDTAFHVHQQWMKSPPHHENLMNPRIDRIGVALVPTKGVLYAVADYAEGVAVMSMEQVEESVAKVVASQGIKVLPDGSEARQYCAQEGSSDKTTDQGSRPRFLMRWQSAEITKLPPQLAQALASKQFWDATVGACEPQGNGAGKPVFSGYRVAVLLY
jgi:hypothetical protein